MKLTGKVLVVTGAGSGIGRAVALEAVRRAGRVAAVDLNATTLEETAALAAADGAVSTHVLNITDQAAVEALPAQVIAQLGVVDGLVQSPHRGQNEGPTRPMTSVGAVQETAGKQHICE